MAVVEAREPVYEVVGEKQPWQAAWKVLHKFKGSAKVVLVLTCAAVLTAAWERHFAKPAPARAPMASGQLSDKFAVTAFPQDCKQFIRYQGCEGHAWDCDQDWNMSVSYRCCCDTNIWPIPQYGGGPAAVRSGDSQLRLKQSQDLCLAGPKDPSGHLTLAPCGHSKTRVKLPPRGAGTIQLVDLPGKCLGVAPDMESVKAVSCKPWDMQQMFQLTNGDKGMLQWSHGGNKCLDLEKSKIEAGSKIVLGDCIYWPLKASQVFVLEDAPVRVPGADQAIHPSLFCASLMLPHTYEVDMLRSHLARNVGIFACTGWVVFSNERVRLKKGATDDEDIYCDVMNGSLKVKFGGAFDTALNTPVFRRFWTKLIADGRAWKHDWTLKVDPDCVFFANRLTDMLKNTFHPNGVSEDAVWLNNCQLGMHGPIEVFNKAALGAYADGEKTGACDAVAEKHGQEDVYLRQCFAQLGVRKMDAFNLLLESEWACTERPGSMHELMPPCYDRQVSFHPFKTVKSYWTCYEKAKKMHWSWPLAMNSVPPGKPNHFSA